MVELAATMAVLLMAPYFIILAACVFMWVFGVLFFTFIAPPIGWILDITGKILKLDEVKLES